MNITIHTFWFIFIPALVLIAYFIKECFFKTKDTNVTTNIIDKFPLVSWGFRQKSLKEQNIENNQEIHEINKRFDKNDKDIQEIKETLDKIIQVIEEMQKRG